ncbi:sterol desaturase family protein [Acuticoccus sp.]|uniref:sterol desaturase family protein n=1 Tax=Acuticoccus sp. TaxID=1904378 RepID=UPI003B528E5B
MIEPWLTFLSVWALTYALVFGSYLAFGWAFTVWARGRGERKIQPRRDGLKRRDAEIRASARSLVVTCACFAGGLTLATYGVRLFDAASLSWWSAPLMFAASVVLFDAWFYAVHRLAHTAPFKRWHLLHHQSVAPTVWSNYSDTAFDAFTQQGYFLAMPLLTPFPVEVFVVHRVFDHFNGMIGHSGYEVAAGPASRAPWPLASVTFHDMHHATFSTNYANHFSFWDRVFGTIHPDYDRRMAVWEAPAAAPAEALRGRSHS